MSKFGQFPNSCNKKNVKLCECSYRLVHHLQRKTNNRKRLLHIGSYSKSERGPYLRWPAFACLDGKQSEHSRRHVVVTKLPLLPLPLSHHWRLPWILVLEKIASGQRTQQTRHPLLHAASKEFQPAVFYKPGLTAVAGRAHCLAPTEVRISNLSNLCTLC